MPAPARNDRPPYAPQDVIAGKYAIRKILGEGGMAVVYAAVDTSCDRQVAIKVLRPSAAARRALSSTQMQREAAMAVRLHQRTPHVVEVLTAGVTDGSPPLPYYVMERLWGTTLREGIEARRARDQRFEIIEVASTVAELALPVAYAHDMGVVHRDIKPENVFMAEQRDSSCLVKLLDFGVSALLAEAPTGDARRAFGGSRSYASPEQLDGRPPTPAADVYALGLVLFEMLTCTLPHDRLNPRLSIPETALNVYRAPLPPLSQVRKDVPRALETLIHQCLGYDPASRPSALQLARGLRDIKARVEQDLLGALGPAITDVSGPPTEVTAQRLQNDTGDTTVTPLAVPSPAPAPADHEVFFMNPVHNVEAPGEKTGQGESVTADAFGSQTQPDPMPPGRSGPSRGVLVFLAASLLLGVGVSGAVVRKAIIRGNPAPAASSPPPSPPNGLPRAASSTGIQAAGASASAPDRPPASAVSATSSSHPPPPRSNF